MDYKFAVGDNVIFVNDFGVVWGIKKIIALDSRTDLPTYHYENSDTPWFSVSEKNFTAVSAEDFGLTDAELQAKYGFKPTDYFGCY